MPEVYFHLTTSLELFKTLKYFNQLVTMLHGLYSDFVVVLCESLNSHCTIMNMKEMKLLIVL